MPRQPDHPHIQRKIFATKLRADPDLPRLREQFLLQLQVAERAAVFVPTGRKGVVVAGRGHLDRL